ncbi:MAG: Lin0512 family protein [Pseudomonadota bacterium]
MALKRMVVQLGMGVDLQGGDYTKAARRAVHNALRQNSLTVAPAFGIARDAMQVTCIIGAGRPEQVNTDAVAAEFPYGQRTVQVVEGGMDTPKDDGAYDTIMVNAAVIVDLDLPDGSGAGDLS